MSAARNIFQKIPFIRITSLFLIGILLQYYLSFDLRATAITCTLFISVLIFMWRNSSFTTVKIQNVIIACGILISGLFYPGKVQERQLPAFDRKDYFLAEVCQKPAEKANTFQTILLIQNRSLKKPEKIIAYFSKFEFDPTLKTGDQLIILARPQEIKNMGNPFEFDYQSMMKKKGIWFSVYLDKGSYLKTGGQINRMIYLAERMRDKLVSILAAAKIGKEERSVVAALTLGYRTELDPETTDYFASTGAMHVLAVSGLHVGLIYFILGFLLSPLKRTKIGTFFCPVGLLSFLWIYAFITGFSPSVQRATVMFSFIIIGSVIGRPVNIYNSLSASALVLLLLNPNIMFEVGFQLSYLAVFGIVLIQPKLAALIVVKSKYLKWGWDLFTVSLAAQLATFPLGLLYFNQFPNLFWLSNFFVIPGATLIIWVTFGFFVLSPIPFISGLLVQLVHYITYLMVGSLKLMSSLPNAVAEGIVINPLQTWILYGILLSAIIFLFSKNKRWLFVSLSLVAQLQIAAIGNKIGLINQKTIYVYNSRNTMIHLINGRTNYLLTTSTDTIPERDLQIAKRVKNHLRLNEPIILDTKTNNSFRTNDIDVNDDKIQFLNCLISYSNGPEFQFQGQKKLMLEIQNHGQSKKETLNKTIAIGNSYFTQKQASKSDFSTKVHGAYFLNLE
jgi:competence protein ComEC